jgi:hypothetical protein
VGRILLQTVITPRKKLLGSVGAFEALNQQLVSWEVTLKAAHPEI